MTVSSAPRRAGPFLGNGVATAFPFAFKVFDKTDIRVTMVDVVGQQTTLVLDSDYSVTVNVDQVNTPGGSVTYPISGTPLATGATLSVIGARPYSQALSIPTGGNFNASALESSGLDALEVQIQQLAEILGRALQMPEAFAGSAVLPSAALRAGMLLGFDTPGGNLALAGPTSGSAAALALQLAGFLGSTIVGWLQTGGGSVQRSVSDKLREWVSTFDKGAVADGVTNTATAVSIANTEAAARHVPLKFEGIHHIGSPITITVPIVDTIGQIFTPTSQVTIDNGQPVRPEWWGPVTALGTVAGRIRYAVNALPANGGTIKLRNAAYHSGYDTATAAMFNARGGAPGTDYMVKQHVRIIGEKLGEYNAGKTQMQNGTIVQGTWYISSECTGLYVDLVSVDVGTNVITALYGGADHDAFCVLQCNKAVPAYGLDVHIGRVSALGSGAASLGHGVLLEAISGHIEYAEAVNCWHGCVLKTNNFQAGMLVGRGCFSEDVILKSDSYATLNGVAIDTVVSIGTTPGSVAGDFGLLIQAATAGGGEVSIGKVVVDNKNFGIRYQALTGMVLADIQIGQAIIRSCTSGYDIVGQTRRTQIGRLLVNVSTTAVVSVYPDCVQHSHHIGSLSAVTAQDVVSNQSNAGGGVRIGDVYAEGVAGNVFVYGAAAAAIMLEGAYAKSGSVAGYTNLTAPLAGTWVNYSGTTDPFGITLLGGKLVMDGLIKSGAAGTICTLPTNWRPATDLRLPVLASTGAAIKAIELVIASASGVVSISDLASTTGGYLNLRGVEWEIPF